MDPKTLIAVGLGLAFAFGFSYINGKGNISSEEAHALVANGAHLVDVRTPSEYASGHVDGAKNIPVQQMGSRMKELTPKDKPIVLYCRSGARSGQAAKLLRQAGYTDVHNLGAMSRW